MMKSAIFIWQLAILLLPLDDNGLKTLKLQYNV